jgi:hypothetical protein
MMSEVNGNGRLRAAADSAVLALLARVGIAVLMTLVLPLGAWMGSKIVGSFESKLDAILTKQDVQTDKLNELDTRVTRVETRLDYVGPR